MSVSAARGRRESNFTAVCAKKCILISESCILPRRGDGVDYFSYCTLPSTYLCRLSITLRYFCYILVLIMYARAIAPGIFDGW